MTIDRAKLSAELEKTNEALRRELASIRTGRATPALLEDLKAEYYGAPTPLQQLGSITAPEPNMLVIQAWDASAIPGIERAIRQSDLGLNPAVDGQLIRVTIPPLTEERREELSKLVRHKGEQTRIRIRTQREEAMRVIRDEETAGRLSEDQAELERKHVQQAVDGMNHEVEQIVKAKEAEIQRV